MKLKKLVILLVSIIFPIVITVFIGLYSYGSFGNWDNNQTKFINSIFNENVETTTSIDNYAKFASSHYMNVSENMTIYSDYKNKTVDEFVNGAYTIKNSFTFSPYLLAETNEDTSYISYMFFLYDINYNNVTPANVYFISVQNTGDENADHQHLLDAIEQFNSDWVNDATTGAATVSATRSTPYAVYDIHSVLTDEMNSVENVVTPYIYSFTPNRNYTVVDEEGNEDASMSFEKLGNCSFAMIETVSDKNSNPVETKVLVSGELQDIKKTPKAASEVSNINLGYGSTAGDDAELKSLQAAGYTKYVLPTLAWQCAIALVVSGFIAFLFYKTWTLEEDTTQPKKIKKE